jgi:hypothetical protein|tara:strand:+ start:307 stop:1035 length:729 start_codon:yes stop_codon:yes gene_type:complete
MSKTTERNGRLCNQIIRNLALSFLAKKYDLYVEYSNYDNINNKLGIELFIGNKKYDKTVVIDEKNYMNYFNNNIINNANFDFNGGYFHNEEITTMLYNHLTNNMKNIIDKNPYKERYNNNNDIFLHIRLTDAKKFNVGIDYYIHCINSLKYDNIYIGSDNFNDELIIKLKTLYPSVILIDKNPIETIQFGSTCKNIILSHGSFSAVIGYLGFFSNVYFMNEDPKWCTLDMFINKNFIPISLK